MICITKEELAREQELLQELEDCTMQCLLDQQANITQVRNAGLWEWNLHTNQIFYSPRWKIMLGFTQKEVSNSLAEWLLRVNELDLEQLLSNLFACRQGLAPRFEVEYSLLHQDREYRFMNCKCVAIRDEQGQVKRLIGSQTETAQPRKTGDDLRYQGSYGSTRDGLTNLPSHQSFTRKIELLSQLNDQSSCCFSILCLDVDQFQYINHKFGHRVGDRLLVEIVQRLQSCLGSTDILARLGGDEFSILVADFAESGYPLELASKIQKEFSLPLKVEQNSILISVSIGIALSPGCQLATDKNNQKIDRRKDYPALVQLLQNAEIALGQAKSQGKASNSIFEPARYLADAAQSKSADELCVAVEQEQFTLHYQPIVQLQNNQLAGFEALVRWQHPQKGLLAPVDFVSLAEATGLIMPLGWWVLRCACEQMSAWQQNPAVQALFISVNISSKQFSQPYASDIIAQILSETGLDPHCLKLEITETEIIANIDVVLTTAKKLKNLGVKLSLDDFGTGYSSLSYLHCLPVDTIKIDRSFIKNIESDLHKLELVKAIVKLAKVFDLDVVAEGIEQKQQLNQLLGLSCRYGQGYLFSRPVAEAIATKLIQADSLAASPKNLSNLLGDRQAHHRSKKINKANV